MSYRLVIEFDSIEELIQKLKKILSELESRQHYSTEFRSEVSENNYITLLIDENVRKVGELVKKLANDEGIRVKVYEVDSSISSEVRIGDVTYLPIKDDVDVLRWAKKLNAILVTGDKRLANTAIAYGLQVIYIPPSGVISKEHYAIEVVKKVKELITSLK